MNARPTELLLSASRDQIGSRRAAWWIILAAGIILLLAGCRGGTPPESAASATVTATATRTDRPRTATVTPTDTATLRPSSTPLPTGTIVPSLTPKPTLTYTPAIIGIGETTGPLRDDFSDPNSGWAVSAGGDFGFAYENDAYTIYNNLPNAEVESARTRNHTNVTVEADVVKLSGPDDAYFGVTCRKRPHDYYSLTISGDGSWGIYKTANDLSENLISGTSTAIHRGDNVRNHLKAVCSGSTLTLFVNDVQVVQYLDPTFQQGVFIGFVVGTHNNPEIRVSFDNFNSY